MQTSTIGWPSGPPPAAVAELLRSLEFSINRKLDGQLHGQHQGITPGHGSEPGESRTYQPGDDVRRIDWNVTARTRELHVREQIADRDLEAWIVVDVSAAMHFGTRTSTKAQIALAAAATVGFLTARNQNRVGSVLVAGPHLRVTPPRLGRDNVRAILQAVADCPDTEGLGRGDLPDALRRVGALSKRRGFICIISDFAGDAWSPPMSALAMRHDLLAIGVVDPRELDMPPIGLVTFCDPSTGATREVMVTDALQRKFADRAGIGTRAARTDRPCIGWRLAGAVDRRGLARGDRRTRASAPSTSSDGPPMSWDFLAPYRLWLLLVVAAIAVAYVFAQRRRVRRTMRFTQIEMLDQIAPHRPSWRRHAVAGVQLVALTVGVIAAAQPVERSTTHPKAAGKIILLFDVSLSMQAEDVAPNRLEAAKQAGADFVDAVDPDVEVGLISFSGTIGTDVDPTTDRAQLIDAINALELGEGTAIGDAIAAGVRVLQRGKPTEESPGTLVVLSDGETTRGRPTADGAQIAADANVPVYTIAFGTEDGTITNPDTGEIDPVPVKLDDLQGAADATGGKAYVAPSTGELAKAYDDIRANLQQTTGDAVTTITELTWRYVLAAVVLLMIAWVLGLWWLRGPL